MQRPTVRRKIERKYRTTVSMTAESIRQWNEMVANGLEGNLSAWIRREIAKLYRETIGSK